MFEVTQSIFQVIFMFVSMEYTIGVNKTLGPVTSHRRASYPTYGARRLFVYIFVNDGQMS